MSATMSATATKLAKLKEFGSWSEQTSSSGKRYYYNRETEVSQWEKPTDWKEHEKTLMEKYKLSRSSSKTNFSTPQQPPTTTTGASSSKPSAGDASAMAAHPTIASSSTSTPLSGLRHHVNSSSSSSALRTPAGLTTGHNSNSNNVTPSGSQTQSSSQRSRPSESLKRPRGGDDRHHPHHSSSSSTTAGIASGSGATTKPAGGQSSSPFATPQSGTFDRTRGVGEKSADRFTPTLNGSSSTKSQPTGFTPMPSRPAMSGGGGDASAGHLIHSPLSSKYQNQNSGGGTSTTTTTVPSPLAGQRQSSTTSTPTSNNNSNLGGSLATSAQKFRSDSLKRSSRDEHPPHAPSSKIACMDKSAAVSLFGDLSSAVRAAVEKPPTPVLFPNAPSFNEAKYVDFYRPELTTYRRNWSSQAYIGEARRCAERSFRQTAYLAAIDDDLRSVRSLMGAAELRCTLLDQKLVFIRGQIAGLETKNS